MDPKLITDIISEEQAIHFFYSIVAAGLVFWLTSMVHCYVKSIIAYNKVIGSARIAKNNILRFPTATGTIDGRLLNIDRKRVEVEFDDFIKTIPTKIFVDMEWNVVKNKSYMNTEEDVELIMNCCDSDNQNNSEEIDK